MNTDEIDLALYTRRPRERFTQARVIVALKKAAQQRYGTSLGLTKRAARHLRCAESTVRSYIQRYPKVRAVKEQIEKEWRALVDDIIAEIKGGR